MKYIYLIFIFLSTKIISQTKINDAEIATLKQFYHQTNGENWIIPWDFNKDPYHWYGLKINKGSITEIKLNGNGLKGSLSSLSNLPNLTKLDLSSNQLSGSISSLNNLQNLQYLDISDNNFEGDLSNDFLGNNLLTELYLGKNKFTLSNPNQFLEKYPLLTHLDLSNIQLKEIPTALQKLNNITSVVLDNNELQNNYNGVSNLKKLEYLSLANNKITLINDEFSKLITLKKLNLDNNLISNENIRFLGDLHNLEWLSLEKNELTNIPAELGSLTKLIHLNLGRNKINNGFSNLNNLKSLQQLWLHNNKLEGEISLDFSEIPNLLMLSLASNQLYGELPNKLPPIANISNNHYNLNNIQNYIKNNRINTEFIYSPQRYDAPKTIYAVIGSNTALTQSLNTSDGYNINWYKNLDEPTYQTAETYRINNLKLEDYIQYTAEAHYIDTTGEDIFEISFFREPITLENSLATEDLKKQINIYPNPTKDFLNILSNNIKFEASWIFDLSGKIVLNTKENRIDVSHLPSGAYIISIKTTQGLISFKFIKL